MEINIAPKVVTTLFDVVPVTTANVALFAITLGLLLVTIYIQATAKMVPGKIQLVMEGVVDFFHDKVQKACGVGAVNAWLAPMTISFFLIVLCSNLFGAIPLLHSVVLGGETLMTTPTAHLSMTLAFTLVTLVLAHLTALAINPINHIGNFIKIGPILKARSVPQFMQGLLDFALGLLDIVGELAKIVSLSCRLFGNVLAGELMVVVVMGLSMYTQMFAPIPFMVLALLSSVVQAAVFGLLALQYVAMAAEGARS